MGLQDVFFATLGTGIYLIGATIEKITQLTEGVTIASITIKSNLNDFTKKHPEDDGEHVT